MPASEAAEVVVRWLSNRNDEKIVKAVVHEKWSSMRADLIVAAEAEKSSQPHSTSTEAAEDIPRP